MFGLSKIGDTLTVFIYLSMEDASEELARMQEARKELNKQESKDIQPKIREFRAV